MSLVSWRHNDRRQQWEATDDEGRVVSSITDEALSMMPEGALQEFWASAIFIRKAVNETHPPGDSDSRDGCADGMLKLYILGHVLDHTTSLTLCISLTLRDSLTGARPGPDHGDRPCPGIPGYGTMPYHDDTIG